MTTTAKNKGKSITVRDLTLKLPAELPFEVLRHSVESPDYTAKFLEIVLGEEQAEKVWDLGLGLKEGTELPDKIVAEYSLDMGK